MSLRDDKIFENAAAEAALLNSKRKIFFHKRTRMHFRTRLALFTLIFCVLIALYMLSFMSGNPLAAALNNWTDTLATGLSAFVGSLGSSFARYSETLQRILTFGPISYIFFSAVVALVFAGCVATGYSVHATRHALDDGTPNFKAEPRKKA